METMKLNETLKEIIFKYHISNDDAVKLISTIKDTINGVRYDSLLNTIDILNYLEK